MSVIPPRPRPTTSTVILRGSSPAYPGAGRKIASGCRLVHSKQIADNAHRMIRILGGTIFMNAELVLTDFGNDRDCKLQSAIHTRLLLVQIALT